MLPIGQLPDAANAKAAAANARTLVRRCSAAVPQLAASSRWCSLLLGIGALLGSFFPMVLLATRHRCSAWQFLPDGALRRPCHYAAVPSASLPRRFGQQHFPDGALPRRRLSQGAPPRRPGQQQTSFGGEKYSGLASNLTHLGRIC